MYKNEVNYKKAKKQRSLTIKICQLMNYYKKVHFNT